MAGKSSTRNLPKMAAGQRYGRLTAIQFVEHGKYYDARWHFRCDCGNEIISSASSARKGNTKSCGCFKLEVAAQQGRDTATHGRTLTREYFSWCNMLARCTNPKNIGFKDYGGRGITVCDRWRSFENFLADMGDRPTPQHSIDRWPNNNGNYEPGNVRWATKKEQAQNRRLRRTYKGRPIVRRA